MTPAELTLRENMPHDACFSEDSFLSVLHETSKWDADKFWALDKALRELAVEYSASDIPRDIAWPVLRVFGATLKLLHSHLHEKDSFAVHDLLEEEVMGYLERVELTLEGFFEGRMLRNSMFEMVTPLFANDV